MRLKLFTSKLENEDVSQFPYLKERIEGAVDIGNFEIALKIEQRNMKMPIIDMGEIIHLK